MLTRAGPNAPRNVQLQKQSGRITENKGYSVLLEEVTMLFFELFFPL